MQTPTILIIEYDHDTRITIRRALENSGFSVISRTDIRSALETLKECPSICLIILEWKSFGSDGPEFLESKERHSAFASVPVIVIAEYGLEPMDVSGISEVLTKPVVIELLLEKVRRSCQRD